MTNFEDMSGEQSIESRLSQIRKEQNMSMQQFASELSKFGQKITHANISRYEAGKFIPKFHFYDQLMKAFGYNPYWVMHGKGEKMIKRKEDAQEEIVNDLNVSYRRRTEAPIYGQVFCGVPAAQWQEENIVKFIPTDIKDSSAFGVIAKGDSMSPYINDRDILICIDNPHLIKDKSAVVTVFKSEPDSLVTNAKLITRDFKRKQIVLYSINTKNPPEIYNESEILKIYKVVRIIREVK